MRSANNSDSKKSKEKIGWKELVVVFSFICFLSRQVKKDDLDKESDEIESKSNENHKMVTVFDQNVQRNRSTKSKSKLIFFNKSHLDGIAKQDLTDCRHKQKTVHLRTRSILSIIIIDK